MALPQEKANELEEIAEDAYVFGYPLVLMELTKNVMTNVAHPGAMKAPINQFAHADSLPGHTFRDVVRPNRDTLYSSAWLDLSNEPMILHVPDTSGRYYLMPILDAYTNVFNSTGARTTGTEEGDYAIVGPGWIGSLPEGVSRIDAPTNTAWIIGRTRVDGNGDIEAASAIQSEYTLTPLSAWGTAYTPPRDVAIDPNVDSKTPPLDQIADMDAQTFFGIMTKSMKVNPIKADDGRIISTFSAVGIEPGQELNIFSLEREVVRVLEGAMMAGHTRVADATRHLGAGVNNWKFILNDIGTYGTKFTQRAAIAMFGLGANLVEDAIYPVCDQDDTSQRLSGANKYVLSFPIGQHPPIDAFWSITVYDDKGFISANDFDRYTIGDRYDLSENDDGSIDILIQREDPGDQLRSNWLPTPAGEYNLTMRLYAPKAKARNGTWVPPRVKRTKVLSG